MMTLKRQFSAWREETSGASAIEAAICFPIILLLAFAIFQYGIFYNNSTDLNKKLRDASRQAKLLEDPAPSELAELYKTAIENYNDDVELNVARVDRYGESFVEISMTYSHDLSIPFLDRYSLKSRYKNLVMISNEKSG